VRKKGARSGVKGRPRVEVPLKVVDAAERLFAERGFSGATTRQICHATGLSASSIYYHFGSKRGLYRYILDYTSEKRAREFEEIKGGSIGLWEKLDRMIERFVRFCAEEAVFIKLVKREQMELREDVVSDLAASPLSRLAYALRDVIRDLGYQGSSEMLVASILGMVVHRYEARTTWQYLEGFENDITDCDAVTDHVKTLIHAGICQCLPEQRPIDSV
jgi:AcrR family transcriptional regulator